MSRNRKNKGLSLSAAAWFYSQPGFHGNIREMESAPVPVTAADLKQEEEVLSDEPEWSDSDTTREMVRSIGFFRG